MNKYAIIYSSKTGNTKKIAEAMASVKVDAFDVIDAATKPDLSNYELIAFGYGVDKGAPYASCQELMGTIEKKAVILFQTLGAEGMGDHAFSCIANGGACLGKGNHVIGAFSCQGAIDPKLIERMRQMPAGPHAATPENEARWAAAASHPDSDDLARAKEFMEKTLNIYEKFYAMMHKK